MDSKSIMKIADLPVHLDTKLTPSIQDKLCKIIEQEFMSQSTIYNSEIKLSEQKIIDRYRKISGAEILLKQFEAVVKKQGKLLDEKCAELDALKEEFRKQQDAVEKRYSKKALVMDDTIDAVLNKLKDTPFDKHGNTTAYERNDKGRALYDQMRDELEAVSLRHPQNLKNKIIARLLIATTTGEAMVILRDVLGNGVLPTLSKTDFLAIEQKIEQKINSPK